jgi:hypothetical protein
LIKIGGAGTTFAGSKSGGLAYPDLIRGRMHVPQQGGGIATLARILCAIDLERASERAFDRALNLAIISEAKLHLLHATPANVPFSWRATERLQYLTGLRERAEAAGVKFASRSNTVTPLA